MISKKEIINFFDAKAQSWDKNEKKKTYSIAQKIILKYIKLYKYDNVLDVGCGTGICYPYLKKRFKNYTGIDISEKMIEIAKKKFKSNFINGDFNRYKFKSNYFDLVIFFNSFPHFEPKEDTFKKAYRILKKNGKLIIAHSFELNKINQIHRRSDNKHIKKQTVTVEMIKKLFKQHNFKNIKIKTKNFFYAEGSR